MTDETWTLRIDRDPHGSVAEVGLTSSEARCHTITLTGLSVSSAVGPLRDVLLAHEVKPAGLASQVPLELSGEIGRHVDLLMRAVAPLRSQERAASVAAGVASMSCEEAAYWWAKSAQLGGLRALRILTSGAAA